VGGHKDGCLLTVPSFYHLTMKDFFISYTGNDRAWAEWVAWILEEAGYSVVMQAWDFCAGENFVLDMQKASIEAKKTISILSELYLEKPFPQPEWAAAFAQDPTSKSRTLIPIRVESCKPAGLLSQIVYVDIFDCDEEKAQERLLSAVKDERMKPTLKPRFPGFRTTHQLSLPVPFPHALDLSTDTLSSITHQVVGLSNTSNLKDTSSISNLQVDESNFSITQALYKFNLPSIVVKRPSLEKQGIKFIKSGMYPILMIQGLSGYGKTVLMSEIAKQVSNGFDFILPIRCIGLSALDSSYLVETLNNFLCQFDQSLSPQILQNQDIQHSLQILAARLIEINVLILIDGVEEALENSIRNLVALSNNSQRSRFIITGRCRIIDRKKAHTLTVPPFSEKESSTFIQKYSKVMNINIDTEMLIKKLPKSIKENPQNLHIFLSNLEDVPSALLLMDNRSSDIELFEDFLKKLLHNLDSTTLKNLILISILEGLDLVQSLKILNINPSSISLVSSLNTLLKKSLIYSKNDTYLIPSPVKEYIFHVEVLASHRESLINEVVNAIDKSIRSIDINKLNSEIDSLINIVSNLFFWLNELSYYEPLFKLGTDVFLETVNIRGFWKEYCLINRLIFMAAKETGNKELMTSVGFRIVRKSFQVKDIATGRQVLLDLEALNLEEGTHDYADLLSHKALFSERDGDFELALDQLDESLDVRQKLGDAEGCALVNKLIGNIYIAQNNPEKAYQFYNSALSILNKSTSSYKLKIEIQTSLGLCDLKRREYENTELSLKDVIQKCKKFSYEAGLPRAYYTLALTFEHQGKLVDAIEYATRAIKSAMHIDQEIAVKSTILLWRLKGN
jgi:tetratricopeptide (TPR) repeat protein